MRARRTPESRLTHLFGQFNNPAEPADVVTDGAETLEQAGIYLIVDRDRTRENPAE